MRRFHYGETKAQKQAEWMDLFNQAVVEQDAKHAGRIEWETATHLFNLGLSATYAAHQYVTNRRG